METKRHRGPGKPRPRFEDLPDEAYVRHGDIFGPVLPISSVTGWRWIRDGKFPSPDYINGLPFHKVRKVREFLRERAAATEQAAA